MPSATKELGQMLGNSMKEQSKIKENLSPDEFDQQFLLYNGSQVIVQVGALGTRKVALDSALVFDQPASSQMFDNVNKEFDEGYDATQDVVLLNLQF
jgi:hypothetical protein